MTNVLDLTGLWRRTLLQVEGREADRTTQVFYLQGPRFFVDLRQPADLASFDGVRCLRDLTPEQLRELARQEGFAGILKIDGTVAEWQRHFDFQPETGLADRAQVQQGGDTFTETGTEAPYFEHWVRESDAKAECWSARLVDGESGRRGFLARAGDYVMFARDRAHSLPRAASLAELLDRSATLQDRQDMLDCEISFGRIRSNGDWQIERSTLPFKNSRSWRIELGPESSDQIEIEDLAPNGDTVIRRWQILEVCPQGGLDFNPTPPAGGVRS